MTRATTLTPFWTRLLAVLILPAMVVAFAAGCGGNSEPGNGKGANGNGAANNNDELIGGNSGNSGTNTPTGSGNVPDITVPGTDWQVDACREVGPLELTQSLHGYRLRHSGEVTRLAISPDNKWLASGSADNTVRLWQLSTGREVQMFQIGAGEIRDIAFSPDSQRILLGYTGGHVVEWHLGFRRFRWVDTGSSVTAVGYLSADMMRVGAITAEAAMEYGFPPLRNEREAGVTLGTPIRRSGDATQSQPAALPGQMRINPRSRNGALRSTMARFSADGAALAVKDDVRGALQLVSPRSSWAIRKSIPLTDEGVRAMDFTPSANRLIVAHQKSNRITIYHEEGEVLGMVRDRNVPIDALRVSRNGHELWTWGRSDHRFHRFSVDNGGERPTFGAVIPGVKAMAGSSDNRLAVGTDRGDIFVYDTASGQRLLPEDPFARITSGAISASGSHIAVGTVDSTIRVVRTSDRSQPIEPLHLAGDDAITGVGISDDGSIVMAASSTRLLVHSVVANSEQWSREVAAASDGRTISCVAMSGNGRFVLVGLTGAAGAGVELWDTLARKKVGEWGQAGDGVGATLVAFSPRADRAVAVFSRHAAGAAPGTTEGKPWRVQFIDTSDITAIKPGKSFDIDVELSSVQITDDRQTLGLSLGGSGLNAVRLSDTGVEPVASIGTAGLARPFYWTGDKRWVLAGSTEHRFSIYDASGNAGGTELAPAGSADMTAAWDRPRLIAASLPVDNGQRTARDVMIVTERNAILLFRLNLTASGNNNGGNGNGNGESVPGGSNE